MRAVALRGDKSVLRHVWRRWTLHVQEEQFEREVRNRTAATWHKVQGWMQDTDSWPPRRNRRTKVHSKFSLRSLYCTYRFCSGEFLDHSLDYCILCSFVKKHYYVIYVTIDYCYGCRGNITAHREESGMRNTRMFETMENKMTMFPTLLCIGLDCTLLLEFKWKYSRHSSIGFIKGENCQLLVLQRIFLSQFSHASAPKPLFYKKNEENIFYILVEFPLLQPSH